MRFAADARGPQQHAPRAPSPVLDVRSLSKTYPGQVALDGGAHVLPGEIHALVGPERLG